MTSRLRRKHRITARNLRVKNPANAANWQSLLRAAGRTFTIAAAVASAACPALSRGDDFGRPPAAFQLSDDAIPIEAASDSTGTQPSAEPKHSTAKWADGAPVESANAWKLRWRKPMTSPPVATTSQKPLAVSRASATVSSNSRIDSMVRLASQNTPVDPFEEPYPGQVPTAQQGSSGSSGQSSGSSQPSTGGATQPSLGGQRPPLGQPSLSDPFRQPSTLDQPSDPPALGPSTTPGQAPNLGQPQIPGQPSTLGQPSAPFGGQPRPMSETQPPATEPPLRDDAPMPPGDPGFPADPGAMPMDQAPIPPRGAPSPESALSPIPEDMPCDRVYNSRNCCSDDAKCRQARQRFSQQKINTITLDITPSFTNAEFPSSPTYVPTDVRQEQELAKAPSRVWKNKAGQTVAEGRFADYKHGFVHIRTADGEIEQISFNELSDDDLCFVTAWWSLPTECRLGDEQYAQRDWIPSTLTWKASALCHKPLYFEEVALERYGHSVGPIKQPFVSGAHFFGSLVALPYQMGIHPINECQYALGYYRPGSCAPWLVPPFPVSVRGGLAQAGAVVGGIYIIP